MTLASHTPGPWTIEEYGDDETPALVIHKDTETRVCFMATPGSHGDPARIEADARLIAAAPDGLQAATMAYLLLLQLPQGSMRLAAQATLAHLRDFIAAAYGQESEYVQDLFEERARTSAGVNQ